MKHSLPIHSTANPVRWSVPAQPRPPLQLSHWLVATVDASDGILRRGQVLEPEWEARAVEDKRQERQSWKWVKVERFAVTESRQKCVEATSSSIWNASCLPVGPRVKSQDWSLVPRHPDLRQIDYVAAADSNRTTEVHEPGPDRVTEEGEENKSPRKSPQQPQDRSLGCSHPFGYLLGLHNSSSLCSNTRRSFPKGFRPPVIQNPIDPPCGCQEIASAARPEWDPRQFWITIRSELGHTPEASVVAGDSGGGGESYRGREVERNHGVRGCL